MTSVFIIAEAGVNHNGELSVAKKMIDAAVRAKADAVKFQTFIAENVISKYAPKAEYQKKNLRGSESQLEMVKKFQLSYDDFRELHACCKKKKIIFMSSPFDLKSIDFLASLQMEIWKIPSGEITNLPYLRKVGALTPRSLKIRRGKRIFLSTGMSNLKEIMNALNVLISAGTPKKDITVLHCNTEYPTPVQDVNLRAMQTIRRTFGVKVGYSDHTLGIEVPVAAVAMGATVIEKHFTLDKKMKGPDHKSSLEPDELKAMVRAIRNIEQAMGDGIKKVSPSEAKNKPIARKSILAVKEIRKGETFTEKNITAKRPGTGISPMEWDNVLGKTAKRNFKPDELIEL